MRWMMMTWRATCACPCCHCMTVRARVSDASMRLLELEKRGNGILEIALVTWRAPSARP